MGQQGPVRLAILGAGIFATDAYTPVLREISSLLLPRFVWSRSQVAAEKLAAVLRQWAADVEAVWGEEGLHTVETSQDVPCCAVVLPIQTQPAMVKRMLKAGKHVLQEKPLGATYKEGLELLQWYSALPAVRPFWGLAENFRLEPAFAKGAELLRPLGKLLTASVCIEVAMAPSNKYYGSQWRRDPNFSGAFIADCGVHYISGLREFVQRRIDSVSAHFSHMNPNLPPPDNITATFTLEAVPGVSNSECSGTLQITFCAPSNKMLWRAVCEGGVVEVGRGTHEGKFGYKVLLIRPGQSEPELTFVDFGGIDAELRALAAVGSSLPPDEVSKRNLRLLSPLEAMEDLAVIHACLSSGQHGGAPTKVHRDGFCGLDFGIRSW